MRLTTWIASLLLLVSCAAANAELSAAASVDEILDALDARGKNLRSFTADVKLIETDAATGDASTRHGKVWYQQQENSPRIRVTFDKKESNNRIIEEKLEYLLAGPELVDRTYRTRTQVTRQVLKPGQKMDLFKLGEGPFPLPIGQARQDVHAQFDVTKVEPGSDDPPGTVHLKLTPKPDTRLARRFNSIDVWVDLKDHFPRKIETLDRNESSVRGTELSNVRINTDLSDRDFALPRINESEWQLTQEAYTE